MRREHQKQIQALEAKCKVEETQCTNKIQQEYDNEKARAAKEEAKARQSDTTRLQNKVSTDRYSHPAHSVVGTSSNFYRIGILTRN